MTSRARAMRCAPSSRCMWAGWARASRTSTTGSSRLMDSGARRSRCRSSTSRGGRRRRCSRFPTSSSTSSRSSDHATAPKPGSAPFAMPASTPSSSGPSCPTKKKGRSSSAWSPSWRVTKASSNQPPPLVDYNLLEADAPLSESLEREGAAWAHDLIHELGALAGTEQAIDWGFQANANPPRLRTHDRFGNRIDEVEFHPAWHSLLKTSVEQGLHALSWREEREGAHVARAVLFYLMGQVEAGHGCPISMTHAAVPALRANPELAAEWEPLLTSLDYDPGLRPAAEKRGALCGMAMTERQGGSDVRANATVARRLGEDEYELTGHKRVCSAPMCAALPVLAQAGAGLA